MFKSARLKLTLWYLLIIMLISAFFSLLIYMETSKELERGFKMIEVRLEAKKKGINLPHKMPRKFEEFPQRLKELKLENYKQEFQSAQKRVKRRLIIINLGILVFSGAAGYFLAGETLKPIKKAMKEQKRFIADASHEFRTPLTALKTSMEVSLRNKKLSLKRAKKIIKSNLEEVNNLQSLSDRLLQLAGCQSNGQSLIFEKVDILQIIKKTRQKILPLAREKNIHIEIKAEKEIIFADREKLEKMMIIFLDNAVKYTLQGKIIINTESSGQHLVIQIKDPGVGIAKEELSHIFERFYRVDQSRSKNKVKGFGLGLSLAKKIIELHKGSVKVTSKVGKGTTFTIKLPLKRA